jgi:predicted dehydrogenase
MKADALRIGLIGVGHRAKIAQAWEDDPRSQVVAGADINEKFLDKFRHTYAANDPFTTTDYRELIARDDIDAVGVFTPDPLHCEPTVQALRAGKHVFVEKPMAISIEEADEMLRASRETGNKLMVAHNMRYMDRYITLKQIIDSGKLGEVKAIWMRHFCGKAGYWWFHDYRATREGSNTILLAKGSHIIDVIHFLGGSYTKRLVAMGSRDYFGGDYPNELRCENCDEQDTCPEYSTRDLDTRDADTLPKTMCAFRKEIDIEDHTMLMMDMGDVRACYLECQYTPMYDRTYLVVGTEGQAELSMAQNKITVTTQKANDFKSFSPSNFLTATYEPGGSGGIQRPFVRECRAFLDLIIDDVEPDISPEAARMAVAVGCRAAESMRNGSKTLDVPPCPE